jgi:uncharacterized protein
MLVGLISDTHGLVRPAALEALKGSQLIIHAGDIGTPEVLDELRAIAPTFAVRGNNDTQAWSVTLPEKEIIEAGERQIWYCIRSPTFIERPSPIPVRPLCSGTRTSPGSRIATACCTSIRGALAPADSSCP